ncbi:hypothetical protein ACIQ9R_38350 [Streptomyces sp. NPDC094447]|uniref:hypothetical protein n=1 Tax=Streptomyces sp. NPDC094447 TaxID=3366062 RepID=UPI003800D98F
MSDRQTFTARAEAALHKADQLVAKTNSRAHYNLTNRELDQVDRDRQEAGLLIQSAAVWAQLAHVAVGGTPCGGKAAAGQAVADHVEIR